jgi:hypothetical protein
VRRLIHAMGVACALLAIAGCATSPRAVEAPVAVDASRPLLRLAPAALGRTLALQQQLTVTHGTETHRLEALLEADATELRLVVQAVGRSALRLRWDGTQLEQTRADWLPPQLGGERVLSDLQLAYWPVEAITAALPAGWTLEATDAHRVLREGDVVVTECATRTRNASRSNSTARISASTSTRCRWTVRRECSGARLPPAPRHRLRGGAGV